MASPIEIVAPVVETLVWLAPELLDIPLLGRILIALGAGHPMSEEQALKRFQEASEKDKETRKRTRDDNNKHVIKVSDALECVENQVFDPKLLASFIKVLWRIIKGEDTDITRVMYSKIEACMLEKMLRQDTPRVSSEKFGPHRPARGHGVGRKKRV